jgi:SAM-dependent methyltransferase
MNPYRRRILDQLGAALAPLGPIGPVLDFGSGDGFFAHELPKRAPLQGVTPVDVVERAHSFVKPQLYDGQRLPFADGHFELAYSVDVVHHCPDPLAALADLARCTRRWLLLKDHQHDGALGGFTLAVLDELGNRRFGIPSPYRYQRRWEWVRWIEARGFVRRAFVHPMRCHSGPLALTNGLQFMGLWERIDGQPR